MFSVRFRRVRRRRVRRCKDFCPCQNRLCQAIYIHIYIYIFDHTHDLDLEVFKPEFELALSQEWDGLLTWDERDVNHPFMTKILT